MRRALIILTILFPALLLVFCTGKEKGEGENSGKDLGIGPIKSVMLGPINQDWVSEGRQIFTSKCAACHMLDQKLIGPPLRDITKQQTPEFIMNMLLNTQEMQQKNNHVKQLLAMYRVPMINNQLTEQQARSILEYLRAAGSEPNFR